MAIPVNIDHTAPCVVCGALPQIPCDFRTGGTVWLPYTSIGRAYRTPITRQWQRASPWHNPYRIGHDGDRAQCCALYHDSLEARPELLTHLGELAGRVLVCWCAPDACHGEDLLHRLGDGSYERYQAAVAGYRITEGRARQ